MAFRFNCITRRLYLFGMGSARCTARSGLISDEIGVEIGSEQSQEETTDRSVARAMYAGRRLD